MNPDVQAQLDALRRKFAGQLPDRLEKIEAACAAVRDGAGDEEPARTAYRLVHNLAGAAGTHGFVGVGAAARELEAVLKPGAEPPDETRRGRAGELLDRLRQAVREAAATSP